MNISENLKSILDTIPVGVKLVAVSKTKPNEDVLEAYNSGQRVFGENKVQDLAAKYEQLPKDIEWHMIGHLQSNKVKYIASFVKLIEAVDSYKLLKIINKEASKNQRIINCLLQLHIAEEEAKFGFELEELFYILGSQEFKDLHNIKLCGVMGMATFTNDDNQIRKEFRHLKDCYNRLKEKYFADDQDFKEVSMGMSGDYLMAIEEGSTMVRVGSSIFGVRY